MATIAILSQRASAEAQAVNEQLTHALNSRIVIEQAKGMVAQHTGSDMEHSFIRFRRHARNPPPRNARRGAARLVIRALNHGEWGTVVLPMGW